MTTTPIADELLTEAQAVARIPGRDSEVRAWLRGLGISRLGPTGVRVYRWAEILAALPLESAPAPPSPAPQGRSGSLRRIPL